MNDSALTKKIIDRIAQTLIPGCSAKLRYRIGWDEYRLRIDLGEEFTEFVVYPSQLQLSVDAFEELLKTKLPPEWLAKESAP